MNHDAITAPLDGRRSRRRRLVVLVLLAGAAVLLIPVVYGGGLAYGASWLERDEIHATYYYV